MYDIDSQDQLVELSEFPRCDVGAPAPVVIATDFDVFLSYVIADNEIRWNDKIRPPLPDEEYTERRAVVRFHRVYSQMLGMPNDEALPGHPLWQRGLQYLAVFRVEGSSWTRRLEQINSVHEQHDKDEFLRASHYIFAFHDSTFECVSRACELVGVYESSKERLLSDIVRSL